MKTACSQKSPSGVRTACTLKLRQAVLIHQRHSSATFITPLNPSQSIFQAARALRAHAFRVQFASNLFPQATTAQTQAPLRR
jgi:hypothetical protein